MSTRRSKARSMMRSLRLSLWPWIAHVSHSAQFLKAALIITPEFGTRVERRKIDQRFSHPRTSPRRGGSM